MTMHDLDRSLEEDAAPLDPDEFYGLFAVSSFRSDLADALASRIDP